jgi:hypothetical protein
MRENKIGKILFNNMLFKHHLTEKYLFGIRASVSLTFSSEAFV